jgi:hypothetical protein
VRAWFASDRGALTRRDEAANTFLHLVTARSAPRDDLPVLPEPAEGGPTADELAVAPPVAPAPAPVPMQAAPATVADDLREQLVTVADRVSEALPDEGSRAPAVVAARFEAHAERVRAGGAPEAPSG